jgi:hypothetical protein
VELGDFEMAGQKQATTEELLINEVELCSLIDCVAHGIAADAQRSRCAVEGRQNKNKSMIVLGRL